MTKGTTQTQRLDDATSFPLARTSPRGHSVHFKRVSWCWLTRASVCALFFELINPNFLLCFRRKTVFPKFQKCNELVTSFDVQVCVKVCARKKRKTMRSCSSEQREKTGLWACAPHAACAASAGFTGFRGGGPAKSLMPCFLCTASSRLSSMSAASTCSSARDARDFLKCLSLVCARDLSCSL